MKTFQIILNNEVLGVEVVGAFMNYRSVSLLAVELGYPKGCSAREVKKGKL